MTPARLAELRRVLAVMPLHNAELRDLLSLIDSAGEDAGRWVPWKPGDALLELAKYRAVLQMPSGDYVYRDLLPDQFDSWEIIAYWSIPLPPPYAIDKAMSKEAGDNKEQAK